MILKKTTLVFFLKYSIPGPVISASSHSADFSIVWIYKFYFSSNRAYFRIRVFIILGYISNSNSVFHQYIIETGMMYMTERLFCVYEGIFLEQGIALGHIFGPGYLLY